MEVCQNDKHLNKIQDGLILFRYSRLCARSVVFALQQQALVKLEVSMIRLNFLPLMSVYNQLTSMPVIGVCHPNHPLLRPGLLTHQRKVLSASFDFFCCYI